MAGWADAETLFGAVLKMLLYKLRLSGNMYTVSNAIAGAFSNSHRICITLPCQRHQCNNVHPVQTLAVSTHPITLVDDISVEFFTSIQAQQHPPVIPLLASVPNFTLPCPPAPGPLTPDRRSFKSYFPASIF